MLRTGQDLGQGSCVTLRLAQSRVEAVHLGREWPHAIQIGAGDLALQRLNGLVHDFGLGVTVHGHRGRRAHRGR